MSLRQEMFERMRVDALWVCSRDGMRNSYVRASVPTALRLLASSWEEGVKVWQNMGTNKRPLGDREAEGVAKKNRSASESDTEEEDLDADAAGTSAQAGRKQRTSRSARAAAASARITDRDAVIEAASKCTTNEEKLAIYNKAVKAAKADIAFYQQQRTSVEFKQLQEQRTSADMEKWMQFIKKYKDTKTVEKKLSELDAQTE